MQGWLGLESVGGKISDKLKGLTFGLSLGSSCFGPGPAGEARCSTGPCMQPASALTEGSRGKDRGCLGTAAATAGLWAGTACLRCPRSGTRSLKDSLGHRVVDRRNRHYRGRMTGFHMLAV